MEGVVHIPALIILLTVLLVIPGEFFLVKGGHPHPNGGRLTKVGQTD